MKPDSTMTTENWLTVAQIAVQGVIAGGGVTVAVLVYRLNIKAQAAPQRQEMYKRQADAIAKILQHSSRVTMECVNYVTTFESGNAKADDYPPAQIFRVISRFSNEIAPHTAFLPKEVSDAMQKWKSTMMFDNPCKGAKTESVDFDRVQVIAEWADKAMNAENTLKEECRKIMYPDAITGDIAEAMDKKFDTDLRVLVIEYIKKGNYAERFTQIIDRKKGKKK